MQNLAAISLTKDILGYLESLSKDEGLDAGVNQLL